MFQVYNADGVCVVKFKTYKALYAYLWQLERLGFAPSTSGGLTILAWGRLINVSEFQRRVSNGHTTKRDDGILRLDENEPFNAKKVW